MADELAQWPAERFRRPGGPGAMIDQDINAIGPAADAELGVRCAATANIEEIEVVLMMPLHLHPFPTCDHMMSDTLEQMKVGSRQPDNFLAFEDRKRPRLNSSH